MQRTASRIAHGWEVDAQRSARNRFYHQSNHQLEPKTPNVASSVSASGKSRHTVGNDENVPPVPPLPQESD